MNNTYILSNIKTLLIKSFSETELRSLCQYKNAFKPLAGTLPSSASKEILVNLILEYSENKLLLDTLLTWAEREIPERYLMHQPYKNSATQSAAPPTADDSHHSWPNPFRQTMAIKNPACFIGRDNELKRLHTLLQGGSVSLLGPPKIGKSSLLLHLIRTWPGEILPPIDCQAMENEADFYHTLARRLTLDTDNWRTIRAALREREALLILDELDTGPDFGLAPADLGRFRAVCSQNQGLKVLTASRLPLKQIFPDTGRGSPTYNFLQPLTLGPLTDTEAHHLLSHPWAAEAPHFDQQTISTLLALTKYHPFRLQRAAFHCYHSLSDPAYSWREGYQQDMDFML